MTKHHTEDIEALELEDAPERYRAEVIGCGLGRYEVDLVTTHVIHAVGERGEPLEFPTMVETRLESPALVLGERWAAWKGRRMVAAAYRRDVREQQPWAVQR